MRCCTDTCSVLLPLVRVLVCHTEAVRVRSILGGMTAASFCKTPVHRVAHQRSNCGEGRTNSRLRGYWVQWPRLGATSLSETFWPRYLKWPMIDKQFLFAASIGPNTDHTWRMILLQVISQIGQSLEGQVKQSCSPRTHAARPTEDSMSFSSPRMIPRQLLKSRQHHGSAMPQSAFSKQSWSLMPPRIWQTVC